MMREKLKDFLGREKVLCISALCALGSMFLVPPSPAYAAYIDWRVLGLLWCLMAVVAGFRKSGAFDRLTWLLLTKRRGGSRTLGALLVLLPFFISMAVTNDVALLTFVPFTIGLLETAGCRKSVIPILVLQTLAANLGSMATPVGNPQNLFLYGYYGLSMGQFFALLTPLTLLSLLCLTAAALPVLPREMPVPFLSEPERDGRLLTLCAVLFGLCLCTVGRALPWYGVLPVILIAFAFADRGLLKASDYGLLATFVCFFIFSGNLGRMPAVSGALRGLLEKSTLLTAVLTSQFISNVPAAVLLAPFTENWRGLLLGTNIGGLGTPVASLANLITLKLYCAAPDARPARYLLAFTAACIIGLVVLLGGIAVLY